LVKVKERWGKLTDDDLGVIRGERDQLVGKVLERYGILREEAERQVDDFEHNYHPVDVDENREVEEVRTERTVRPASKSRARRAAKT
jgi:uncharacterized protein YjbJ (UPF0337 family)